MSKLVTLLVLFDSSSSKLSRVTEAWFSTVVPRSPALPTVTSHDWRLEAPMVPISQVQSTAGRRSGVASVRDPGHIVTQIVGHHHVPRCVRPVVAHGQGVDDLLNQLHPVGGIGELLDGDVRDTHESGSSAGCSKHTESPVSIAEGQSQV